jgi:hypothetical protein
MRTGVISRVAVMVIMWKTVGTGIGRVVLGPPLKHRLHFQPPTGSTSVLQSCILVAHRVPAIRVGGREAGRGS